MRPPYIVQRLHKPYEGELKTPLQALCKYGLAATGLPAKIKEILSEVCVFDYMGSSEYEFGAIPKALKALAINADNLCCAELSCSYSYKSWSDKEKKEGSRTVYVICDSKMSKDVHSYLDQMARGEEHCKERTEFAGSLAEHEFSKNTVGWFDLANGFMFFKDKQMFEDFRTLLGVEV